MKKNKENQEENFDTEQIIFNENSLNEIFSKWKDKRKDWSEYKKQIEYFDTISINIKKLKDFYGENKNELEKLKNVHPISFYYWEYYNTFKNNKIKFDDFIQLNNFLPILKDKKVVNDEFLGEIKQKANEFFDNDYNFLEEKEFVDILKLNIRDATLRATQLVGLKIFLKQKNIELNTLDIQILDKRFNLLKDNEITIDGIDGKIKEIDYYLIMNKIYYSQIFGNDNFKDIFDSIYTILLSTNSGRTRGTAKRILNIENDIYSLIENIISNFGIENRYQEVNTFAKNTINGNCTIKEAYGISCLNGNGYIVNKRLKNFLEQILDKKLDNNLDLIEISSIYESLRQEYRDYFNDNIDFQFQNLDDKYNKYNGDDYQNLRLNLQIDQMIYSWTKKKEKVTDKSNEQDDNTSTNNNVIKSEKDESINGNKISHQIILYGPPGTGKTYSTKKRAVEICDNKEFTDNAEIKKRYNELVNDGRIEFITFHQSYGYEDFIEGIKPNLNKNSENGSISFHTEDGVFKKFCKNVSSENKNVKLILPLTIYERKKGYIDFYIPKKYYKNIFNFFKKDKDYEKYFGPDGTYIANSLKESTNIAEIQITYKGEKFKKSKINILKVNKGSSPQIRITSSKLVNKLRGKPIKTVYLVIDKNYNGILYDSKPKQKNSDDNKNDISSSLRPNCVFIIDEINRGNISKIFGELITLIEEDKRDEMKVKLPYSHEEFTVPKDVYIIGTMNTSDRSIALLDTALRRRFKFEELMPDYNLVSEKEIITNDNKLKINPRKFLKNLNSAISFLYDPDHQIGHSYFMENDGAIDFSDDPQKFIDIWYDNIIPLIREYFYNDWEKLEYLLGKFIKIKKANFEDGKISENNDSNNNKDNDYFDNKYGMINDFRSERNEYNKILSGKEILNKFSSLEWLKLKKADNSNEESKEKDKNENDSKSGNITEQTEKNDGNKNGNA